MINPNNYLSVEKLMIAVNNLLETADDTGCTPDLVVVDAAALRILSERVKEM